jgi:hypothetical protein
VGRSFCGREAGRTPPYRTLSHSSDICLPFIAVAGKYKLSVGCSIVGIESVVLFGFDLFA